MKLILAGDNCSRFHMLPKTSQFVSERKLMQLKLLFACFFCPPTNKCGFQLGLVLREYKAGKKLPPEPPVSDAVSNTSGYMFNTDFLLIIVAAFLNMEKRTRVCGTT